MGQPYVGEIRMFAGNFAPAGWAFCEGQLVLIAEYDTLFNLIGTTYGGDGQETFALPDLRGRVPVHMGSPFVLGEQAGVEEVTLTANQIPVHSHSLVAVSAPQSTSNPENALLATPNFDLVAEGAPGTNMAADGLSFEGGNQPHTNMQPYQCINFIISFFGIYPSPT